MLVVKEPPAEATFPSKNGKIAFVDFNGRPMSIYTIKPGGGGSPKTK
jgi:hypothetical protein